MEQTRLKKYSKIEISRADCIVKVRLGGEAGKDQEGRGRKGEDVTV